MRESYSTSSAIIGTATVGLLGTVVSGPKSGSGFTWWKIDWDNGNEAWSAEGNNRLVVLIPDPPELDGPGSSSSPGPVIENLTPTFRWDSADGATKYNVYFRKAGDPAYQSSGYETATSWAMPVGVLDYNTSYRWNMTAFSSAGESAVSQTYFFRTPQAPSPPNAPSDLTASVVGDSIELNWYDNSNNETGFKIERQTGTNWTQIATATPSSYTDSDLQDGTYRYRVRAYNGAGDSSYSNIGEATVPGIRITAVKPDPLPGTFDYRWITIKGSGFKSGLTGTLNSPVGDVQLSIADIKWVSNDELQVRIKTDNRFGQWKIRVHGGTSDSNSFDFSVVNPPSVTAPAASANRIVPQGTLPQTRTPNSEGIIVIIHGTNQSPQVWADEMASLAAGKIATTPEIWDISYINWEKEAKTSTPILPWSREKVRANAINLGQAHGKTLRGLNYPKVHFIAHSAGCWLAEYAAREIEATSFVHTTFLDAYTPDLVGVNLLPNPLFEIYVGQQALPWEFALGQHSTRAEHYFTSGTTNPLAWSDLGMPYTDCQLDQAENYEISDLFDRADRNPFEGHEWPHIWYRKTATNGSQFGFAMSPFSGGATRVSRGDCIKLPSQEHFQSNVIESIFQLVMPISLTEDSAYVGAGFAEVTSPDSLTLVSHSPAWITTKQSITAPINYLCFSLDMDGADQNATILSVFLEGNIIASYQPELESDLGKQRAILLPGPLPLGECEFAFRLDTADGTSSSATLSDLRLGYLGPLLPAENIMFDTLPNGGARLQFSTYSIFDYIVQESSDLKIWSDLARLHGNPENGPLEFAAARAPTKKARFFRIKTAARMDD